MKKVFLLGNPRSGTSLLRIMLNANSHIASPPESGFSHWWYKKYKGWNSEAAESESDLRSFVKDILSSKKIEEWNIKEDELLDYLRKNRPSSYSILTSLIYQFWAKERGKNIMAIVDKNNYYINHLADLVEIWPDCYFIHLVRDGRDVACSYLDIKKLQTDSVYKPILPNKIKSIALEWSSNNSRIMSFLMNYPSDRKIRVSYEDIVVNTEKSLKKLARFIGVPFEGKMLEYYLYNDEPVSTIDWKIKTLKKPDQSNVYRHKLDMSSADKAQFDTVAQEVLKELGYDV